MTVYYKPVKIKTPLKRDGNTEAYYPRIANRQKKDLRDVAEKISAMSTFSTTDVVGVLEAFVTQIPHLLLDNCSVELGDFGTFSLHVGGEGVDDPKDLTSRKIKSVKMAFRPGVRVKSELKNVQFKKIPK
ncbi:hypothetical protein GCQ56_08680 [Marinifilum sp. N1E240]|uniref:HU family DNA-binding protein n=1 Tax=Marinifilum sp. N1E240 TaxID=2608082 RepID=UPI00128D7176|nr:HU family DNA-binding protein [Marinifilum sp. N1E240]MPQ47090.1 hypothetical protein [Marinifilum sp. N1E240]|eukprot:TRINITY_DN405908_c9_g1_i1.p1 TRINITY_DN405908_c9_g1~~TRINITY_DN405908_c9_g1_i1.p1  ORF type:complete len:130 (-),score=13.80 TRINITY_DN405908_c9_g1_i1:19-408(-)